MAQMHVRRVSAFAFKPNTAVETAADTATAAAMAADTGSSDDIPDTAARMPLWENVQAQDIMAPQALRERVRSVRVVPVQTATE